MDMQRDFPAFRRLMGRLCETLGKPLTDELLESWWKALKSCDFAGVERKVENFIARADEQTRFPRPAQMRPDGAAATVHVDGNPTRDYWRSSLVCEVVKVMRVDSAALAAVLQEDWEFSAALRKALDDLCRQEGEGAQRTDLHRWCMTRAAQVVAQHGRAQV